MSTASKARTGNEVIEAIRAADTPAKKAKATRLKNEYVARRVAEGKDGGKALAGLLSHVNRSSGGAAKTASAPVTKAKATPAPVTDAKPTPAPKKSAQVASAPVTKAKSKTARTK